MQHRPHDELTTLVQSFFREHLERIRGASPRTILAYRDAVRLFLCFLADSSSRSVSDLSLDDIVAERVLAFLDHLEVVRGNGIATRNQRLAAVRALAEHILRRDPTRAAQCRRILDVPTKKVRPPPAHYLEPSEVRVLLRQPDRRAPLGRRDHALLLFLYNTGARVSEALAVCRRDLRLERPWQVRLHGKGNKDRFCPLWRDTAEALIEVLGPEPAPDGRAFLNAQGRPLTRDGVAYLIGKYVKQAAAELPTIARGRITPHVLRHSCAVALLQAGIDITVIRDYLGHVSVATTSRYLSTNLEMKRDALQAFWRCAGLSTPQADAWKPTAEILAFLDSL